MTSLLADDGTMNSASVLDVVTNRVETSQQAQMSTWLRGHSSNEQMVPHGGGLDRKQPVETVAKLMHFAAEICSFREGFVLLWLSIEGG